MEPLEKLKRNVAASFAGMSEEDLCVHPSGKWCAAEVLEHLYLTYTGTIKGFERVMAAGKPTATPLTWAARGRILLVLDLGYLPSGRESPAIARPRGLPTEKVLGEIVPRIDEMDQFLSYCQEKLGPGKLMDHPFIGPLTAREWKKFHLVHGMHHMKQIRRLREYAGGLI